ncbi:bifunctional [glutamate--ammonia ligase]-adenylyl-L-tyrosine phosphorylase/[glutamate--ammonia-ligase] adenylyltransferase [Parendozoicomonas haliclonae]|uniref:Bifunctional glutamine synthetase adenylyltransferase/adenylyl-removing enzyme n=1 Tax=Parendozoicomonas haliclonae TaxID=1960125 RepID=A0A1X7ALC7_9GAMM|nr:bifunctional [glutamate--ammonia ligase]-adenylyl-L-tyrosine phosphorylase/[glutamate--ammonia-ligase] adenylyltransferase [Parendozoicomonas haliclonae]SMA45716.1 Glutamate-ammonia-ligase adenylyltransferase [Parendozoicomonas haliclonae]
MAAKIPDPIRSLQQQRLQSFNELLVSMELAQTLWTTEIQQQFQTCWTGSDFVWDICRKSPELVLELIDEGILFRAFTTEISQALSQALSICSTEAELMTALRKFRQKHQLRIIFRDLNRLAPMTETTADVSAMADACIKLSCDWLYDDCCQQMGTPYGAQLGDEPTPQKMIVLGMGKLGAHELNLSSDIDLIFCYPYKGETQGAPRTLTNQEFFIRLGQRLIKVLDSNTADGFVFRVDMRLRPYGQSGALVLSSTAMEQYYQDQGRDWERYALIKARWIAGEPQPAQQLMEVLRPFVYRRYIDFGAIAALRDMKQMIKREVARKSLHNNIKLGHGGIREIEFIVQSFQLIHGGRDKQLQNRSLLSNLGHLEANGYLPAVVCQELREANTFLRNTEHALQAMSDKQTQTLPNNPEEQLRLAWVMGFESWELFLEQLNSHREKVETHFNAIVSEDDDEAPEQDASDTDWQAFWGRQMELPEEEISLLERLGFKQTSEIHRKLINLRDGKILKTVRRQSADRINQFMPLLIKNVLQDENPDQALIRLLTIVESVLRRTAYLVLLMENHAALKHLVSLCSLSPWITEQIARHPALLDEFLNINNLYAPPKKTELEDELRQQLAHIPEDDLEMQMESLRYFRMAHILKVAAAQVAGKMPLMKESDYLTWTAETILSSVLDISRRQLTSRHGHPGKDDTGEPSFLIVGYGKLGGIELGPGSDLDLVFIHNGNSNQMTDGERSIDNGMFFTRLGQRIVHMLSTNTISGQLYEVDMRLRPSGNSGLLVSSLNAFEKYQHNEAWTWEHQALVRARCISGDPALIKAFEQVRETVLSIERDNTSLQKDIREMRHKMATNLGTKSTKGGTLPAAWTEQDEFHIKHDHGGIVDIEFIVQYAVLAWSHKHPVLTRWTDNIRILEDLETEKLLSIEDVATLTEAYKTYRQTLHRHSMQKKGSSVSGDQLHEHRTKVITIWNQLLKDSVPLPAS